jgi:outer membrane receptor protein involved in Fe transport
MPAASRLITGGGFIATVGIALSLMISSSVMAADDDTGSDPSAAADAASGATSLQQVVVTAQRLNEARASIETETGASTYTIDSTAITAMPGGANVQLDQVLLQAPDVAQDSFGQLHVRGDHNDLQYRLNGIILPEGISVFSQTLDPRLISSLSLITGALPAEYGLRTAGIVDVTTKSGLLHPGGSVSLYGGSLGTFAPSGWYGGSSGQYSYFISADMLRSDRGIESPDASSEPLHDQTTQIHGFGYFEDVLGDNDRLALVAGVSTAQFEIPNQRGLQPAGVGGVTGLGPCGNGAGFYVPPCLGTDNQVLSVNGQYSYLSNDLDENQHELTQYAILSWQHSHGDLNWQSSLSGRYTSLDFEPDPTGDLLYNGIAQYAFKDDTAFGWQTDSSYRLTPTHTLRGGFYFQHDSSGSNTTSQVLPTDAGGNQTSDVPQSIIDNGSQVQWIESVYLQDEWQPLSSLTFNYGVRYDHYSAYSSGSQLSPRVNAVWTASTDTTVHAGYSRYFTPPPFELIAAGTFTKFEGTTALPPGSVTLDTRPIAERADYYDLGVQQKLFAEKLTLGVDSFFRTAQHLLDEGQFGAPIILTPFNYRFGRIGGIELTANYSARVFSAYANLAFQTAKGKEVESSQFNFSAEELAYIADNYIHLDHEQRVSASGGMSYLWRDTRFSADMIFGTGLRQSLQLADGSEIPNGDHTPSYVQVNLGLTHAFHFDALGSGPLTARFDVINLFDKVYQIRSGSGIGVFAPQYGARRGFFGGLSKDF